MRDTVATLFRASRTAPRAAIAAMLLAAACALGGCAGGGAAGSARSRWPAAAAPPWRFESIDGPPPQVFDRMVDVLDSEIEAAQPRRSCRAKARPPTACAAISRRRSCRGRTMIAWVWDVYDGNQQRALRLSGEEPAGKAGRDALGRRRRPGAAENRASRPQRPQRHDQRRRRTRRRLPRRRARLPAVASAERPSIRSGWFRRQRAGLQPPLTDSPVPCGHFCRENRL